MKNVLLALAGSAALALLLVSAFCKPADAAGSPVDNDAVKASAIYTAVTIVCEEPLAKPLAQGYFEFAVEELNMSREVTGQFIGLEAKRVISYVRKNGTESEFCENGRQMIHDFWKGEQ